MINKENLRSIIKSDNTALIKVKKQLAIINKLLSEIEPIKKEILILDDENDVAISFKQYLESTFGNLFTILISNNGDEALEIIKQRKSTISLLHTDLNHPGLYGIDLIKYMNKNLPGIKILVVTAYCTKDIAEICKKYSDFFLDKPIELKEYGETINKLLNLQMSLLLPYYLHDGFKDIFECYGFKVLWSNNREELENIIQSNEIDLALEWQHGEFDFTIRDLLSKNNKNIPIFLCLNWNGKLLIDYKELGYCDWLEVPFPSDDFWDKFYKVLPEHKRKILTFMKNLMQTLKTTNK